MTPQRLGAIVGAYTGILCGRFHDLHQYVEELLGRPVWTHEMSSLAAEIKEKAKPDFIHVAIFCGAEDPT